MKGPQPQATQMSQMETNKLMGELRTRYENIRLPSYDIFSVPKCMPISGQLFTNIYKD